MAGVFVFLIAKDLKWQVFQQAVLAAFIKIFFLSKLIQVNFFEEWIQITPLSNFMGSELNRPIYRHKLRDGEGLQFRFPSSLLLITKPHCWIRSKTRCGQEPVVNEARFDVVFKSFPLKLIGRTLSSWERLFACLIMFVHSSFKYALAILNYDLLMR